MTRSIRGFPLFRASMTDTRTSTVLWSIGVVAALGLYLPLYPSIGGADSQMARLIAQLPPQLVTMLGYGTIATGAGYTEATFYGLAGFVILVIAATAWGTGAIAADEENGGLAMVLAHGVSRTRVVLERTLATAVRLTWLVVLGGLTVWALDAPAGLGLQATDVVAVSAAWLGLGLVSATAAIAAGAVTGRRSAAVGAGAGIAGLAYVLNALGSQTSTLSWLRSTSPYGWAYRNTPLVSGVDWTGLALLLGLAAVLLATAVLAFDRRDVGR